MRVRTRGARLVLWLAMAVAAVALVAACDDEDGDANGDAGTVQALEVVITGDGVEPDELRLLAPDEYLLTVTNESGADCAFSLAGLVNLDVADGESESLSFATVDAEDNDTAEFGCGDERSGTVSIRSPGS